MIGHLKKTWQVTLSNGLFIHLLGCNGIQVKNGAEKNLGLSRNTYQAYSFDSCFDKQDSILEKILAKESKTELTKQLCDTVQHMHAILHSRQNKALKSQENHRLYHFYKDLYKEIHRLAIRNIDALYKVINKKAIQGYTNLKSLKNIDDLYKILDKAVQRRTQPKPLKNIDNLHKILYKAIKGSDRNPNINKGPKSLLKDIQTLVGIKLDALKKPAVPTCDIEAQNALVILFRALNQLVNQMYAMLSFRENQENEDRRIIHRHLFSVIEKLYRVENILYEEIQPYDAINSYSNQKRKSLLRVLEELEEGLKEEWHARLADTKRLEDTKIVDLPNTKRKSIKRKLYESISSSPILPRKRQKYDVTNLD